ncbi:MAG TPA: glycosyltransferase family 1 protein [Pyrinomonadaceae bacterium]|jgi:glycosyltransferase involved in cell wall biosynthesis|nr:glycosyltransferase family 1 protein [Pyrinomonadaceae bacterium]
MRIGIDGLPLTEILTGIGHYTNELAQHLGREFPHDSVEVISPRAFFQSLDSNASIPHNVAFHRPRRSLWNQRWWSIGLPRYLRSHSFDVFHGTNFEVPLQGNCPAVITIHDLCMLLQSDTQERKLVRRAQLRLPLMAQAATMIITPTASVREELNEHLGIKLEKIVAISEAARDCFHHVKESETEPVRRRVGIKGDYLLYVGTIEPRKNLWTLLQAFEELAKARGRKLQLVLVGRKGWLVDDFLVQCKRSPFSDQILMPGYLSDEDLSALYSSCTAFIYPSVYEGFGLPPVEAMSCGAPVIVSKIPSLLEVTGSAARSFKPHDVPELMRVIEEVLDSGELRQELAEQGLVRARQFSWANTARQTHEVYAEAIERFGR